MRKTGRIETEKFKKIHFVDINETQAAQEVLAHSTYTRTMSSSPKI